MKKMLIAVSVVCCAVLLASCSQGVSVDCVTKMRDVKVEKKDLGASFLIKCATGCTTGSVWGVDIYTTDSSPCTAAVHAGIITADKGGVAKITVVKGLDKYPGSLRNGVTSSEWKTSWGDTAFTVSAK